MVRVPLPRAHRAAATCVAAHPGGPQCADRGPDGLWQDIRGIPRRHRLVVASRIGRGGDARRRDAGGVRLAAQGALQRRAEEPGGAARRDSPHARNPVPAGCGDPHAGTHRRHAGRGAPGDGAAPPAHPRHHTGVALSDPHVRARPRDAARRADRDRGRDPRRGARQAGEPPGAVARAAGAPHRPAFAAHRTLGDAETDRGHRRLPLRESAPDNGHLHCRLGTRAQARPGDRDSLLTARGGHGRRGVGGDLRAPGAADPRASHHTGVREHAPAGGAADAASLRAAGRGPSDVASRQPVQGKAPRRGNPTQRREAQGVGRDRVARAGDRHRRRGPGVPDRLDPVDRDTAAARGSIGTPPRRRTQGPVVPAVARRADRVCRTGAGRARAPARPFDHSGAPARHPGPADRGGGGMRGVAGGCVVRDGAGGVPVPRRLSQRLYAVVQMLAEGFTTRRGRRGAYVHYDGVNRRLRARRGARLAALTSGGAIPDIGDYRVILEPTETFVGTLNEDFAIESMPGDIFQLGNRSYLIQKIESGQVRVVDAQGQPPSIPFWLGEAPGRTPELSQEVSRLRRDVGGRLADAREATAWLAGEIPGVPEPAARQMVEYLEASQKILGVIPTQETLVLERFFDEAGGMQLVLHAPFGSRVNRAWGLALRKRFCRSFNFELQAAATEDAIVLSLGPQHSFPLEDVFQYLKPETAEHLLVQAMLDAPMFGSRWRWNATRALAVLRARGGKKVPTPLQRMDAEDLVAAVFPDQLACPENLVGDREIPDHPLVQQTIADCLLEAMDFPGLKRVLEGMAAGQFTLVARDTTEPSPLAHEVITRRGLDVKTAEELGKLDQAAIDRVREEAWPDVSSADELHDALLVTGALTSAECGTRNAEWQGWFDELARAGRATTLLREPRLWIAAERLPMLEAVFPGAKCEPALSVPERDRAKAWTREDAVRELVRGRL